MPFDIEFFEERAAIREYLGGFDRAEAERLAVTETLQHAQHLADNRTRDDGLPALAGDAVHAAGRGALHGLGKAGGR